MKKDKLDLNILRENYKEFFKTKKKISKSQQKSRSEKHNVFLEEVINIALSANDDKRI